MQRKRVQSHEHGNKRPQIRAGKRIGVQTIVKISKIYYQNKYLEQYFQWKFVICAQEKREKVI